MFPMWPKRDSHKLPSSSPSPSTMTQGHVWATFRLTRDTTPKPRLSHLWPSPNVTKREVATKIPSSPLSKQGHVWTKFQTWPKRGSLLQGLSLCKI
ncbi:hypothetical protein PIB30_024688, partial [Stylosanthes scabra]|nr:hypothetical protein [Stylosanthes scabra]